MALASHEEAAAASGHEAALKATFAWIGQQAAAEPLSVAAHRIVHGGARYSEPQEITPQLLADLDHLAASLPDHLPQAIAAIRAVATAFPRLRQLACFDTAFHRSMPEVARIYALPRSYREAGLQRFGFHGLSYQFIAGELRRLEGEAAGGRMVVAHLGSGASMAAIRDGASIDTTMGFTPASGLVMGTRAGDIDAEAIVHLLEERGMTAAAVTTLINRDSGLLGVSGSSADMRELLEKRATDPEAALAVELFCYRAKKYLGAYAAALGGLDTLVFTGGIGTRSAAVRAAICEGLGFLGIELDPVRNRADAAVISRDAAKATVRVIETDEALVLARAAATLIA